MAKGKQHEGVKSDVAKSLNNPQRLYILNNLEFTVGCVCKRNYWKDLFSGVKSQIRILLPFAQGYCKTYRAKIRYSRIYRAKRGFQIFKNH